MRVFLIIVRRDILNLLKKGSFVFAAVIFPVALVGLLGLLDEGLYGSALTGWDVCAVNVMIYMGAYAAMISTNSFMERTLRPTNLRVLFTPVPLPVLYLGKIVATTVFCGAGYVIDMIALSLCGVHLGPALGMEMAGLVLAVTLASTSIGVFVCCIVKDEPTSNRVLSLIMNALAAIGGVFFSLERLGGAAVKIASFSPFTWLREAAFHFVWNGTARSLAVASGAAVMVAAVAVVACRASFKPEDYV